jgi:glutamate carboxypeptidase
MRELNGAGIERSLGFGRAEAERHVLARLRPYVEIETPSRNAEALTTLSRRVEQELRLAGAHIEAFDVPGLGRNLRATVSGLEPSLSPLLVLAHIDTVHPVGTLAAQPFRIDGDRVEGPGIFDMKAGLALMVEALAIVTRRASGPRRTLRVLVTCDEEIGSHGARDLFRESANGAFAALVPEPSNADGGVKTRRKGVSTYRLDVHGRAAHAGHDNPAAVSAITELVHQLTGILALANRARGTTINIGEVSGGTASNVVAARAAASIDLRFIEQEEGSRVDRALHALTPAHPDARIEMVRSESRPALERTPAVVALYQHARGLAAALGTDLAEGLSGGGSDGSLLAGLGVPVLDGIGPRGGGAHAADEHILLSDLAFRLGLFVRLLETL